MATALDYRDIKKLLNRYHQFSFAMPRKGQSFTPQQKSAITRKFNEYKNLIRRDLKGDGTFIPYPKGSKLRGLDGERTNRGIFYKYPGAELKRIGRNKYQVQIKYKKLREVFIPFPDDIKFNLDLIKLFVEGMTNRYKPDYILWSVNGFRGRTQYIPETFQLYVEQQADEDTKLQDALDAALEKAVSHFTTGYFLVSIRVRESFLKSK